MDSKLTLKLNENVIERAKAYAAGNQISLSRLIENYLDSLTQEQISNDLKISPFVKSIATGKSIPSDSKKSKIRKDYLEFLESKYS